ncbi:glycosyltransferase family 4 protein [Candidatus Bathyarchaeota archaeon]|nr:glycosyltransferase family 4 protein [Candidatus Bathyarchaeota archaeon]
MKPEKKLKILLLSSHFYPKVDGTTRSIDKIIKSLSKRGHRILFVTRMFPGTQKFEKYEKAEVYRTGPSGFSVFSRFVFSLNQVRITISILRRKKEDVDIFEAHGFASMIACFLLKIIFRKPVVLFFHGLPRMWIGRFRWRKSYEQLMSFPFEKFLIRQADRIIVRSGLFAKILINIYGKGFEDRLRVLPHPVDTELFSFQMPLSATPTILFVGSLSKVYGADLLLKSVPYILEKIPEVRIVIVGHGPLRQKLQDLARELGVEKAVEFVGHVSDPHILVNYYHLSTLIVIPLYYEGYILSLVAVEGLSCGRPVVTTMRLEQGMEKIGVFTVKTHDPKDLAQTILHVINRVDLKSIALAARKYIERHHSEKEYGYKLESIYYELIDHASNVSH